METVSHMTLDERRGVSWRFGYTASPPSRSVPRASDREIDTCARCHARRGQFSDSVTAASNIHDGFRIALLEPGLYFADGQMRDEVYNHGSFLQSRMYAKGVTCADCHDPHTGKLPPGNAVCAQCHDAASYDAPSHTMHPAGSAGASCAECHMPTRVYMGVDARHDHSFRIPRPDRTVTLGVPNACDKCHADRGASWAAAAIAAKPNNAKGYQTFAETFAALERGDAAAAGAALVIVADTGAPAIVRASALERLTRANGSPDGAVLVAAAGDRSPLVRRAAAAAASAAPDAGHPAHGAGAAPE